MRGGVDMQWDDGDEYEVVGNGTKDLIVRLGFGYCSAVEAGFGAGALCKETDRDVDALTVPLNTDLGAAGDLVSARHRRRPELDYAARAQLDIGIPLKLDLTPDVVVLDTTKAEVEGRLQAKTSACPRASVRSGSTWERPSRTSTAIRTPTSRHRRRQARRRARRRQGTSDADDASTSEQQPHVHDRRLLRRPGRHLPGRRPGSRVRGPVGSRFDGRRLRRLTVEVARCRIRATRSSCECTGTEPLSCTPTLPAGLAGAPRRPGAQLGSAVQVLPQLLNKLERSSTAPPRASASR